MIVLDALKGSKRIALDTACIIYFIEDHPKYADIVEEVLICIARQDIQTLTSVVTLAEVLVKPFKLGDQAAEDNYRDFLQNRDDMLLIPLNEVIAERAAALRAKYGLKLPDAFQIATAIASNCDAFLTNDLGVKRVTEIRILVLDELELDPMP